MNKLEGVKKALYKNDYKIVVSKNGVIIFASKDRGIKPIFDLKSSIDNELIYGAYVADRVTGKAAAMVLSYLKIKGIFTELISEDAIEILEKNNIEVEYKILVKNILNRSKNDLCPVEKISLNETDVVRLLSNVKEFLEQL